MDFSELYAKIDLPNPKSYEKEIIDFLNQFDEDEKQQWFDNIKEINSFKLFDRFVQSIANFNYINKFPDESGLSFLLMCISIESFFNLEKEEYENSTKTFTDFFKLISNNCKDLVKEKFVILDENNKPEHYSRSDIMAKFPRYVYEKRSDFVHQGIHFGFNESSEFLNHFREQGKSISLYMTIDEFKKIVIDGLFNNLKKEVENGN